MSSARIRSLLIASWLCVQPFTVDADIVLTGGDLYTVSHGVIAGGELWMRDGKIAALGARVDAPVDAQRIDVTGKRIYPGLVQASSVMGLAIMGHTQYSKMDASHDAEEIGLNNANLVSDVAVDPDSIMWGVARANGILTALVVPGQAAEGVWAGRSTLMKPDGWTAAQMTIVPRAAMHMRWPLQPEQHAVLDQALSDATTYARAKAAGRVVMRDLRSEALLPVLDRSIPLIVSANKIRQLREMVAFADRQQLRIVLFTSARSDVARIAPELAARNIPVILQPAYETPAHRWDRYDEPYTTAGKLATAGVKFAVASRGNVGSVHTDFLLPFQAGKYVGYGLAEDLALRAITLSPAEILGVADQLGSLDAGKRATVLVVSGDILETNGSVERAWIDGQEIDLAANHHSQLYERYQRKYRGLPKDRK